MTMLNDRKLLTISAESRALIRDAIKTNPDWQAYATSHDCDLSTLTTRDAIFDCCDALNIDVAAVIAAGPRDEPKIEREPRQPRRGVTLPDPVASVPAPAPAAAPARTAPAAAAQSLLDIIASLAPTAQPIDMSQVRAAIKDELETYANHADLDARFDRLIVRVDEMIAKAANIVTIELKAHDGTTKKLAGVHHPQFAKLLKAMSARQADSYAPNVWLSGPAGSGKTHAAKTAAEALGVAFHYNGAVSMPHELLGFIDAAGNYHRTPFRDAYEHGGVYLFDEVDGSDNSALLAMNAALANGRATFPDGQISRHADAYIIATANTWGLGGTADYVGRAKIDAAFLSRFPVRVAFDYDEKLEQAISGNADFAKRVQKARKAARTAGIKVLIDPRASIAGAALIAAGFSSDEAAETTYLANLTPEQRRQVGEA